MTATLSQQNIDELLKIDEDQLLEELGMRSAVASRDLAKSAELRPAITMSDVQAMGIKDDMKALGARILKVWNKSAYQVVCGGDPEDAKARDSIMHSLGLGEGAAIAAISAALIGVGMMAALAPVLATILVKKFFNPAIGEFCGFWKEKL
jgi:hypothetical protein